MAAAEAIKVLNVVALASIMFTLGLKVQIAEVVAAGRQFRLIALALLANFVLVPLYTVVLLEAFQAPPLAAVGFLILAVCPGAPVGPAFADLARGNVSLATGLMVILAGASAFLAPALLTLLVGRLSPASKLSVDYAAIAQTLLITQMLPLAAGLALNQFAMRTAQRLAGPLTAVANVLLLVVVGLILATQYQTLGAFHARGWIGMLLLLVGTLAIGSLCGGHDRATRRSMIVTTGLRNAAVGLVIATANFAGTAALTAVVAYALVSMLGTLAVALIFGKFTAAA